MSYQDIYKDDDYVLQELHNARKTFGNKNTTREEYEGMEKALGLMYLNCNESVQDHVLYTLQEAEMRRPFFEVLWRKSDN